LTLKRPEAQHQGIRVRRQQTAAEPHRKIVIGHETALPRRYARNLRHSVQAAQAA